VDDVESDAFEHRLQQPGVGALFGPDVVGELVGGPPLRGVVWRGGQPGIQSARGLGRVEGVDQVPSVDDADRIGKLGLRRPPNSAFGGRLYRMHAGRVEAATVAIDPGSSRGVLP
jgi:hypothetical protein